MPFDHFDFLAPFYEKVIPPAAIESMLDKLEPTPDSRLLDAGGGTGRVSGYLQEYFGSVVLSDVSMGMLKEAAAKNDLRPTCAMTETMPFADDHFDRVLMVDALHHVNDQAQTASELWRMIKPGGRIVIQEPDTNVDKGKIEEKIKAWPWSSPMTLLNGTGEVLSIFLF